jgi:hypothetical protein
VARSLSLNFGRTSFVRRCVFFADANSNQTAFTCDVFGRATKTTFSSALSEAYRMKGLQVEPAPGAGPACGRQTG